MALTELQAQPNLEVTTSKLFSKWLFEQKVSLVFSTNQANKVFFLGINQQGRLSIFERTFERPTALHGIGRQTLLMASSYQVWRFENALSEGKISNGYDGLMVPQVAWTTGALEVHDLNMLKDGSCIFANTRFSCVSRVSERYSFEMVWKPYFVSQIVPEDRCHLSGIAVGEGKLKFATAFAATDTFEGWNTQVEKGGVVIDVESNTLLSKGLYMPNSPVFYKEKLYILNSGTGELGEIDLKNGQFTPICFCPGYARGLTIKNGYAIVGLSKFRKSKNKTDLPVERRLARDKKEAKASIAVINLENGNLLHTFALEGFVNEVFDVTHLEGIFCPSSIGIMNDEIRHTITIGDGALSH